MIPFTESTGKFKNRPVSSRKIARIVQITPFQALDATPLRNVLDIKRQM